PLIPEAFEAAFEALRGRGFYPINHLIVVRDEVLEAHPWLAREVFQAFVESKRLYLERLKAGRIEHPTAVDRLHLRVLQVTDDPLPYGVEPNREILERLLHHARAQRILRQPVAVESLFAEGTLQLAG
ncbi:MAG TPA: ABC transporter substrate-binding protein, partial [Acidobacteriota bacterium]|nr:ABC transporter substrate-binding protein [Acidobacteriota bacterium]